MRLGKFYYLKNQISDLQTMCTFKNEDMLKLRHQFDILFIDDDEIPFLEILTNRGFNIRYQQDIEDIRDVSAYNIIMCDINGIGSKLGKDGASLAAEIKKTYPSKNVIAYSAATQDLTNRKYLDMIDRTIPKGTSGDDWSSILDELIEENSNPIKVWKKATKKLLEANVSVREIAELESKYVELIKKKKFSSLESLSETKEISEIIKAASPLLIQVLKLLLGGN